MAEGVPVSGRGLSFGELAYGAVVPDLRGWLLGRVRGLFVSLTAIVLVVELIELAGARTPWWPHRTAALLGLMAAAAWASALHRRGSPSLATDLVPVVAIFAVGVGLGRQGAVLPLLIGVSQLRSLYGARRSVVGVIGAVLLGYLAIGVVLHGARHALTLGEAVVVVGIAGIVVVMRLVAEALAWHDVAAVWDAVLTDTAAELLATDDVEEVDAIVDRALVGIAGHAPRASGGLWRETLPAGAIPTRGADLEQVDRSAWPSQLAGLERTLRRLRSDAALTRQRIESEHRYRVLAERSRDGIYLLELGSAPVYRYVNPAAEDILGLAPGTAEADARVTFARVHPDDRALLHESRRTRGDGREPVRVRMYRDDGSMVWVESAEVTIESRDGAPLLVQGVVRDVTRQREQEQALERALAQEQQAAEELRHLDRLKSTFLQAVSHELRTPLTAVLGAAETLRDHRRDLDVSDVDLLVHALARQASRLGRLLEDLLDVDRLSRGLVVAHRQPTDLRRVVAGALEGLGDERDRVDAQVEPIVAELDAAQVERIVENLLRNAIKHTPPGTGVRLRVAEQAGVTVLTVDDDGAGVPEALRQTVFEPFAQGPQATLAPSPGTGIGLALVRELAELHRGDAWVEDAPSGGARFVVVLPGPVASDQVDTTPTPTTTVGAPAAAPVA